MGGGRRASKKNSFHSSSHFVGSDVSSRPHRAFLQDRRKSSNIYVRSEAIRGIARHLNGLSRHAERPRWHALTRDLEAVVVRWGPPREVQMPYRFTLTTTIPASPKKIYEAWLDSLGHSEMTGSEANMSDQVGVQVSAWDGYISGRNLELIPGERIVQSWRTSEFDDEHEDS